MPRCPNGSRRNPKTGVCESKSKSNSKSKSKSKSKSPSKTRKSRAQVGVAIPGHRIPPMMKFQKSLYGDRFTEEQYAMMEKQLRALRFKRSDVNADPGFWSGKIITLDSAERYAIPESKLY